MVSLPNRYRDTIPPIHRKDNGLGGFVIYNLDTGETITTIPHVDNFKRWHSKLSSAEYEAIREELNRQIDSGDIHTSSWIPGDDWTDTVFDPIYIKSCDMNPNEAALCFGLFLWVVIRDRPEMWAFGRYEKDGIPINGLTYFRVSP